MSESWLDLWEVERSAEAAGRTRVSLIRTREHRVSKRFSTRAETVERTVLFSRTFRPLLESIELDRYAQRLQQIAGYATDGEFGCFLSVRSEPENVEIILYERWFDGVAIHTDELARRSFDASDEQSLVASVEVLADLRMWAERRNDERDVVAGEQRDAEDARLRLAADRRAASGELSQILAAHAREP